MSSDETLADRLTACEEAFRRKRRKDWALFGVAAILCVFNVLMQVGVL